MNFLVILFLVNFLKTLFIILLIYYGVKFVTRYLLPILVDKGMKNMQQNKNSGKSSSQLKGEYVDFEEVE